MMPDEMVKTTAKIICSNCSKEIVEGSCSKCSREFVSDEIIYCGGNKHLCKECYEGEDI
jgi:predicted amidophosphoribosyltransferase